MDEAVEKDHDSLIQSIKDKFNEYLKFHVSNRSVNCANYKNLKDNIIDDMNKFFKVCPCKNENHELIESNRSWESRLDIVKFLRDTHGIGIGDAAGIAEKILVPYKEFRCTVCHHTEKVKITSVLSEENLQLREKYIK